MNLEDLKIQEAKAILYSRMKQPDRVMGNSTAVKDFLSLELAAEGREVFAVLFLDSQHRLIAFERLFLGTIDSASVYPREVLKAAILHNASAVILAHNHPSGVADPSEADMHLTTRLRDVLRVVDVRVLDHIVVGFKEAYSFADGGLL